MKATALDGQFAKLMLREKIDDLIEKRIALLLDGKFGTPEYIAISAEIRQAEAEARGG